jgi:hypothetical protein
MSTETVRPALAEAALRTLAATLSTLPDDQLRALAEGRGRLVFTPDAAATGPLRAIAHRPAARPAPRQQPTPAPELADDIDIATIRSMTTPDEVRSYLAARRFTVPVLRQLARALGPTVPASGRNRAELVHGIVEGTVGFRARSHALSGGAWGRS